LRREEVGVYVRNRLERGNGTGKRDRGVRTGEGEEDEGGGREQRGDGGGYYKKRRTAGGKGVFLLGGIG